MRIGFFEIEPWEEVYLRDRLAGLDIFFSVEKVDQQLAQAAACAIVSTFIYSKLDAATLSQLTNLKGIATRSTGFDHIDTEYCKKHAISVANVPIYGEVTVAEHTFALILALSRRIVASVERTKRGDFSSNDLCGFDLQGKTLGILGLGNIGKHVARIGKAFGMHLVGFDMHSDEQFAQETGISYVGLNEVFAQADILTLHLPLNASTQHTISLETLPKLKRGVVLINTARGGLCDSMALLRGLEEKVFSALGLDVLEEECFIQEERELLTSPFNEKCNLKTDLANHILLSQPNVIITPHNAFNSHEALRRILDTTIENVRSLVAQKK